MQARRRKATIAVAAMIIAGGIVGIACGLDTEGSREAPVPGPDTAPPIEAAPIPRPDGGPPDGGPDADASPAVSCPATHGAMVLVDAGALVFCIDSTEVTNAEYDKFLAATDGGVPGALDGGIPDGCAGNLTFTRSGAGLDQATFPVARIDWCDAHSFCAWAGKRLCGKANQGDASSGEWFAACSNAGTRQFPYGNTYDASACNDNASVATEAVGTNLGCQGGVSGVFDMNGNVTELTDNCGPAGCSAMGGYFFAPDVPASGCATSTAYPKTATDPGIGFRCCSDPR